MADDSKRKSLQETGDGHPVQRFVDAGGRRAGRADPTTAASGFRACSRRRIDNLATTIEAEVIPRLVLSQRAHVREIHTDVTPLSHAGEECIDEFVRLLLTDELEVAYAYVDSVRVRGVTLDGRLPRAARPGRAHLGEMWEEDRVQLHRRDGRLCRLHDVMRESRRGPAAGDRYARPQGRRALLVPMPGEQHTFGLVMVADFFRRAGWDVWTDAVPGSSELVSLVRRRMV